MATPSLLPNYRYRVRRSATGESGPYAFICIVTAKSITLANQYSEAFLHDCTNPDTIPRRRSLKTGTMWSAQFSGVAAPDHLDILRADIRAETPVWYEFELDPQDGNGAGVWRGALHFENLEIAAADTGHVTFTVNARGDDEPTWIPA